MWVLKPPHIRLRKPPVERVVMAPVLASFPSKLAVVPETVPDLTRPVVRLVGVKSFTEDPRPP